MRQYTLRAIWPWPGGNITWTTRQRSFDDAEEMAKRALQRERGVDFTLAIIILVDDRMACRTYRMHRHQGIIRA